MSPHLAVRCGSIEGERVFLLQPHCKSQTHVTSTPPQHNLGDWGAQRCFCSWSHNLELLSSIWQPHRSAPTSCWWVEADLSTLAGTSSLPWSSPEGFGWQSSRLYQELTAEPAIADLPEAAAGEASLGKQLTGCAWPCKSCLHVLCLCMFQVILVRPQTCFCMSCANSR